MLIGDFKKIKIISALLIAILILAIIILTLLSFVLLQKEYYKGVSIEGISLEEFSKEEARVAVHARADKMLAGKKVVLSYGSNEWIFRSKEIGLEYLVKEALEEAHNVGRNGNIFKRLVKVISLRREGQDISLKPNFDHSVLKTVLLKIKKKIDKEAKDATVIYKNGDIMLNKEEIGKRLDIDKNTKLVENHIIEGNYNKISLLVDEVKPAILYKDIKEIKSELSSFSTMFNPSNINRTQNLRLSCSRVDGIVIMPGKIFSMNKALGPRTLENGYREAKVILNNEYIDGVGGGVCQITSTIYNAVLKCRLKVVERTPHSLPSIYVGPGQDATIAEDYIDFKFKNNRKYPIALSAEVAESKVYIHILGKQEDTDYTVKLVSEIIEEYKPDKEEVIIDNSIQDNKEYYIQSPKNGYKSILYRDIYNKNGEIIDREKISEDVYKPIRGKVKVNQYHEKAKYATNKK